jgi:hypothetical protein
VTTQLWGPEGGVVVFEIEHTKLPGVETTLYVVATPSPVKETLAEPLAAALATGAVIAAPVVSVALAETNDEVLLPVGVTVTQ